VDTNSRIRILMVDDHTLFRESVARLLEAESDFEIAGHCASADEALRIVAKTSVDVVLLDYDLGDGKGTDFLSQAKNAGFRGRVLVVTAGVTELEAAEMIRLGIAGVLQSIRDVSGGKEYFEPGYLRSVLVGATAPQAEYRRKKLTERERQVLQHVFEGLANKEIADQLQVSESSVKATLQQLFAKTGVRTRSQLVRTVLENYKGQL
jgi:two-component system nitrate/nitrite response regulator NarL